LTTGADLPIRVLMSVLVRNLDLVGLSGPVMLRDGSAVQLRSVDVDDQGALCGFLEGVSPDSLRRRFFGATDLARAATSLAGHYGADDVAVVAHAASSAEIVAHAALYRIGPGRAEVAFLVTDSWQGRGLGALLFSRLAEFADRRGMTTLVADVLPGNRAMIAVFERSGYPVEVRRGAHGVEVEIDVTPSAPVLARAA